MVSFPAISLAGNETSPFPRIFDTAKVVELKSTGSDVKGSSISVLRIKD